MILGWLSRRWLRDFSVPFGRRYGRNRTAKETQELEPWLVTWPLIGLKAAHSARVVARRGEGAERSKRQWVGGVVLSCHPSEVAVGVWRGVHTRCQGLALGQGTAVEVLWYRKKPETTNNSHEGEGFDHSSTVTNKGRKFDS